jgi:hypothetical protein
LTAWVLATEVREPISVTLGKKEQFGPDPKLALGAAILVGFLVFLLLWFLRRTFGLKRDG